LKRILKSRDILKEKSMKRAKKIRTVSEADPRGEQNLLIFFSQPFLPLNKTFNGFCLAEGVK